jgi:hypothetical protein
LQKTLHGGDQGQLVMAVQIHIFPKQKAASTGETVVAAFSA